MLAHQLLGDGRKPLVLLHGFLGSGRNLHSLARRLLERDPDRRVLVPDLTGHGASPPLPADADLGTLARDVLATVAEAGLGGPVEFVGHSLGGRVGLEALRIAPERLAAVTFLDIAPGPIPRGTGESELVLDLLRQAPARAPSREAFRASIGPGLPAPIVDWLLMNVVRDGDAFTWRIDRGALERLHQRIGAADLWPVVEARPRPLRSVRGGRSPYVRDDDVRRLEAAGCPVVTLAGAGHFLHVDALDALVDVLAGG